MRERRGFTMAEAMILTAVVGLLGLVALYYIRRRMVAAGVSEAKDNVMAIYRGAAMFAERQEPPVEVPRICESAPTVPSEIPRGTTYVASSEPGHDFHTGDSDGGWRCVGFGLTGPVDYAYSYTKGGSVLSRDPPGCEADCFEAAARGDVDGDGTLSELGVVGLVRIYEGMGTMTVTQSEMRVVMDEE